MSVNSLNPLVYTGITNNAVDNFSWLADNLPNNANTMLNKSTIYRACCLKRTEGDASNNYLIDVKIPNNERTKGFDTITVNIPKSQCDQIMNINNQAQVCDNFYRSYCSNIKTFLTVENKINKPLKPDGTIDKELEKKFASTLQYYVQDQNKECACYPYRSANFDFPGVCISKAVCASTIKGIELPTTQDGAAYDNNHVYRPGNDTECNPDDIKRLKDYDWSDSDIGAQSDPVIGDSLTDASGNTTLITTDNSGNIIKITTDISGNTIKITDKTNTNELIRDNSGNTYKKVDVDLSGNVLSRTVDSSGNVKTTILEVKKDSSGNVKTVVADGSVVTTSSSSGSLSSGAIAGIVIGVIVFVFLIGLAIYKYNKR
jgi:hypothetical protein